MNPKQRVMAILRGKENLRVPFTIYETKSFLRDEWKNLIDRELLPVRRVNSYAIHRPNVKVTHVPYTDENGRSLIKIIYETPGGVLSSVIEPAGFTSWRHEYMFKTPDDYKALASMIKDSVVTSNYDNAANAVKDAGERIIVRDGMPYEPMQAIISEYMGTERFCYEWMDNRDEVLKIYDLAVEMNRQTYQFVADGPMEFANYGGNVAPRIIGAENFVKYYAPHYNEAAEVLHGKGKLIGTHMDDFVAPIMRELADTDLDYIEAYDPGMSPTIAEAKKYFGKMTIWCNWPSGKQLEPVESKIEYTKQMLGEAEPGGFIIGITEDVPENIAYSHYSCILDAIEQYYGKSG